MQNEDNKLEILNENMYEELSGVLKKLNKRIYIKLYALVYEKEKPFVPVEVIRIKKTVANGEKSTSISQDVLQTQTNVYSELKIIPESVGNNFEEFKTYLNQNWYYDSNQVDKSKALESMEFSSTKSDTGQIISNESSIKDTRILYANQLPVKYKKSNCLITYILELRNVDYETRQVFYKQPEISFLRMILDYFYSDFYALKSDDIELSKNDLKNAIKKKYNEDGIQFNRRLTRLFFGKLQSYFQQNYTLDKFGEEYDNKFTSQYYVNSLLEKVDDISTLTYESSSPFGSILFMNKDVILNTSIISFTVTFTKEDRIRLEDAKRIRKLLELTNVDKDLYLIADENEIYGLGEVRWNLQRDVLALRLDFTGLSKYNFVLVQSMVDSDTVGELLIENEKRFYRSNLKLVEIELLSVSFKNPRIGEEGYSSEKLKSLLNSVFWGQDTEIDQIKLKIDRLDQVVRKAREQKHGTMVVITDNWTAKQELGELSKQSTLIEPRIINPEYIRFLTSIDGAIYFDTDGNCHAIGVILDGQAKKDIGDASRGARYNSAHRYLHKLKDYNMHKPKDDPEKKCVIVIISEDGAVDLIPELEHEEMLLELSEEIIDLINEESSDVEKKDKLFEKEEIMLKSPIVDSDWLFKIGEAHFRNEVWDKAINFFERGKTQAGESYINPRYLNLLGICYACIEKYTNAKNSFELAVKGENNLLKKTTYTSNIGLCFFYQAFKLGNNKTEFLKAIEYLTKSIELGSNLEDPRQQIYFSHRGRSYLELANLEAEQSEKTALLIKSTEDYRKAIDLNGEDDTLYWFRHLAYKELNQITECIKDLIQAGFLKDDDSYINALTDLLNSDIRRVTKAVAFYKKLLSQKEGSEGMAQLNEFMSELETRLEVNKAAEEAAVHREIQLDENVQ